MYPPEEDAVETEKHPQSMSKPRAALKISVAKKTKKRELAISTAPGSQNAKINERPRSNSNHGRKMEAMLMSGSGRI